MPRIGRARSIESLNNYELSSSPPKVVILFRGCCRASPLLSPKPRQYGFNQGPQFLLQLQVRHRKTDSAVVDESTSIHLHT